MGSPSPLPPGRVFPPRPRLYPPRRAFLPPALGPPRGRGPGKRPTGPLHPGPLGHTFTNPHRLGCRIRLVGRPLARDHRGGSPLPLSPAPRAQGPRVRISALSFLDHVAELFPRGMGLLHCGVRVPGSSAPGHRPSDLRSGGPPAGEPLPFLQPGSVPVQPERSGHVPGPIPYIPRVRVR